MKAHWLLGEKYALPSRLREALCTPSLILYAGPIRRNIAKMLEVTEGRWRPHVKTIKSDFLLGYLLDAGVRKFKCATAREAAMCGEALTRRGKCGDVLVAYPCVPCGANLRRLQNVLEAYPNVQYSTLVERPMELPLEIGVFVDVNPGMDRTGVPLKDAKAVVDFWRQDHRYRGVHCYEGHASKMTTQEERRSKLFPIYDDVLQLLEEESSEELITSGTPAFTTALKHPGLAALGDRHVVSPGTVVLHDMTADAQLGDELLLEPGALVATRIISKPAPGIITVDAGHKAISADAGHPASLVIGTDDNLTPLIPSEEHLPVDAPEDNNNLAPGGDFLYLFPRHICPTVNLADRAVLVDHDGINTAHPEDPFYRTIDIDARGHDLFHDEPLLRGPNAEAHRRSRIMTVYEEICRNVTISNPKPSASPSSSSSGKKKRTRRDKKVVVGG